MAFEAKHCPTCIHDTGSTVEVEAEYECVNCGETEMIIRKVSMAEMLWLIYGELEAGDCTNCKDTLKIKLPDDPILAIKKGYPIADITER